jgi:uncharacterized alkaline shock family protein YloU
MGGQSLISPEVLAQYAADAALEVPGVAGVVEGPLHRHKGVRVDGDEGAPVVELNLRLGWGANAPDVGLAVQERVADYLAQMAGARPVTVDVVFAEVSAPPERF